MEIGFRLVDVFTEVPFAGNQLCVVPDPPADLDTATMAMLAQEIGFSETAFVTGIRPDGYDIRIFTPNDELPFAGHPTLGTAFALVSEGMLNARAVQSSAAGDVPVDVDLDGGTAWMEQLPPVFGEPVDGPRRRFARGRPGAERTDRWVADRRGVDRAPASDGARA